MQCRVFPVTAGVKKGRLPYLGRRVSPPHTKKRKTKIFSKNLARKSIKIFWAKLFRPKAYPAQTVSNRAYAETCVSSELLRACYWYPEHETLNNL